MSGERTRKHSLLAKLMVMLMVVNLFQGMISTPIAAAEESTGGKVNGTGDNAGITIEKKVLNYDKEAGEFDVQLIVTSDGAVTQETKSLDVVLVMDTSGSMDGKRMKEAKTAAKAAVKKLVPNSGEGTIQVGIVGFSETGFEIHALTKDTSSLNQKIDKMKAYGGTYTQDGLVKAQGMLAAGSGKQKVMIVISDGEPSYGKGIHPDFDDCEKIKKEFHKPGYEIWHSSIWSGKWKGKGYKDNWQYKNYHVKLKDGFFGNGGIHYTDELLVDRFIEATVTEAKKIQNNGIQIYSVGIGLNDDGKAVMKGIATDGQCMNAGNVAENLQTVLDNLVQTIIENKISNGTITDPMSQQVEYVSQAGVDVVELRAEKPGATEAELKKITEKIKKKWDSATKTITLTGINLGKDETLYVTYKAKVKEKWQDGGIYTTNGKTTLLPRQGAEEMIFKLPQITTKKVMTDITINKVWEGGIEPTNVTEITAFLWNGQNKEDVMLAKNTGWTTTLTKPKYANGDDILYTVTEEIPAGAPYEQVGEVVQDPTNTFTITNKTKIEMLTFSVEKEWKGGKADKVSFSLYQGQTLKETITLENGAQSGQFAPVPDKDAQGNAYKYTVKEKTIDGYTVAPASNEVTVTKAEPKAKFTNTRSEKMDIKVTKKWVNKIGDQAVFTLKDAQGNIVKADGLVNPMILKVNSADPNDPYTWTGKFSVEKYDKDGQLINYVGYMVEEEKIDGYTLENAQGNSVASGFTFTNTYNEKVEVKVTKIWKGGKNLRPTDVKEVTFILTAEPMAALPQGQPLSFTLEKIKGDKWTGTVKDLPKYANNQEVKYFVAENPVPYFKTESTPNNPKQVENGEVTITNTFDQSTDYKVTITKLWKNTPENFKQNVNVLLYSTDDGKSYSKEHELKYDLATKKQVLEVPVPEFDNDGNKLDYAVKEIGEEHGLIQIGNSQYAVAYNGLTITNINKDTVNIKITKQWENTPESLKQTVKVRMYSDDVLDPLAPADPKPYDETFDLVYTAGKEQTKTVSVPMYNANGKKLTYMVKELDNAENMVDNNEQANIGNAKYQVTYTGTENNVIITNKNIEIVDIKITKQWENTPESLKQTVKVRMYSDDVLDPLAPADPKPYDETFDLVYTAGKEQTKTVSVPMYNANGKKLTYTVKELDNAENVVDNNEQADLGNSKYLVTYTGSETDVTITNTNIDTIDITVTKEWVGGEALRPDKVYFTLTADPVEALQKQITLAIDKVNSDLWQGEIKENLPKYFNGKEVKYFVGEEEVLHFTSDSSLAKPTKVKNGHAFIKNTFKPASDHEVTVTKQWKNTPDSLKTDVEVQLYGIIGGDRFSVAKGTIEKDKGTLTLNVKKYDNNGVEFDHYEVKELDGTDEVEEAEEITLGSSQYQVNYDQKTLTVINTNIDDVELEVIKIWQQPAGVDLPVDGALITLKGNSGVSVRITDNNQMAHVLGLFPKYENGVKVDYQVEEELAGYQSAINKKENGNTITFTVTNAKLQTEDERYQVTKTWVGDAAGSVTFGMYEVTADGKLKQVDTLTLTAADAQPGNTQVWEGKFAAQVAYDKNGEPIRYTVKELDENGNPVEDGKIVSLGGVPYKVKDDSVAEQKYFAFTNTQQTSITVTKTWRGLPQNAAYFGLFQEGSEQRKDKITLTAEDGWKGEFKDIQFKDPAGNQIVYVVRELDKDGNILEEGENTSVRLGNTKYRITRDGYAFTNTELIDLEIAKEWSATIPEGARRSVGIELRANGEVKEKFVLNKENNWMKQFNDLPRWDGTELVTYQVVEVSINGEEITLPQTLGYDYVHKIFKIHLSDGALAITNTSSINVTNAVDEVTQPDDPNKRNIQVVKFWGTTPAEHQKPVVVKLYKLDENGKLVPVDGGEQILSAENNWQAMFANLPRYQERTVKLETLEIKDDVLPQGAPKVEPAKPEEQPNAEQPQSEEQEAAPAEQPAQPSEETTQPTEPQVQPSEQPSAAPAEENQPAETPAAEAETPQTEQENSVPAANGGIAPETPAAENEEQPAETPVEQGQTEQAEQPQQSEAPAEQEQPAAQLQAQAEQIQYFVFEVKVGEEAAGVEPRIGLNDYHIGDYHVEIVDNGKDRVWIFNTHKGAIPEEEQTSVTVTKYWGNTPTDYRQPVQVRLYVDESGDVHPADIEARTLSAANNWTTTFSGLKKTAQYLVFETQIDGQNIDFNVNEKPATYRHGRYIVTISSNGTANVTITNDYELDPLPPYNPDPTPDTPNPYDPTPNNPTTPTTPTTPATNDDNNTINDEPTPESAPAEVPINDPAIPESAPVVEEEGIKEEVLPQGAPELPKTGGMGAGFFGLLGMGLAGLGMLLKKKK